MNPLARAPLYARAEAELRARIARGEWKPGEVLPTEPALAAQLGISQGTLRRALGGLEAQGAIERRHFGDWSMDVADLSKPRTLKNAEQLHRLEQAWHNGDTTCVAVRLLLNFAEHMTGIGPWGQRQA